MKIRCLIVDDEPLAIKVIQSHLKEFDEFKLIDTCRNATQAFNILKREKIDLIFLDIEMPKIDGLSFLKSLKKPPLVLFTTAHRRFALEGFELDAIDYLLKPISLERFMQALDKVQRYLKYSDTKDEEAAPVSHLPNHIFVKCDRENIRIDLNSVYYIESIKNHVRIVGAEKNVITMVNISEMQSKLSSYGYLRIHRSYLVNQKFINTYTNSYVVVNNKALTIGNVYKDGVLNSLDSKKV